MSSDNSTVGTAAVPPRGLAGRFLRRPDAMLAAFVLCALVLAAALAGWIAPFDPDLNQPARMLKPPDALHWLGTDGQGRDLLSRVLYGLRLSLLMGVVSITIGGTLGVLFGFLGAYYRRLDGVLGRVMDVLLTYPTILIGLSLAAILGNGLLPVIVALSIAIVPSVARLSRSLALVVMRQDYFEAGRAIGLADRTLLWRYLGRNCLPPVLVYLTLRFGSVILVGAGLSFLGMGVQAPAAELGSMAAQGRNFILIAPHVAAVPSAVLFVLGVAVNILGDALRDLVDVKVDS